jgi:nucleoside-diphosphate-sugar epimerase
MRPSPGSPVVASLNGLATLSPLKRGEGFTARRLQEYDVHILITGAAGMIGRKLTERLGNDGALADKPIDKLTVLDVVSSTEPDTFKGKVETAAADLAAPGEAAKAIASRPEVIFHLAGVVSGEAELDFDKGYRVNLDGTRALLEAIRATGDGYWPRLVYTSSIAVFGAPFPASIPDDFHLTPLTSYGAQKAIGEALLADYTRRGFCDGVGIRLPSIVVRPGKPNKAASGFFSGIIREPLAGLEAVLPVPETVVHTHASPRAAVGFLMHAAALPHEALGPRINLSMPGVCCTVAEQIASLRRIAGERVAARIRRAEDPLVARIVAGWPQRIEARRARELGFKAESSFDEIVHIHIGEDRGGTFVD